MNVFINRVIPEAGLQLLREAGIGYTQWEEKRNLTEAELIEYCRKHDALLSAGQNQLSAGFLEQCKHLKVIALMSVGYDHVDVAAATALGIPVGNTPGVLSGATADTAFLLMLATSRKAFFHHKRIAKGNWTFYDPVANLGIELNGRTLGIFGLGSIGFEMAKRCVGAYDMQVIYHNRSRNEEAEQSLGARWVSFDELLQQSDVLSVHSNLSEETKGIFNRDAFSKMKRNAIFINTGRGALHNEADLLKALQDGVLWGAGLDVTNPEPMAPDNPLLDMPNVSILPHIGSSTVETRDEMAKLAARNIIAGLRGEKLVAAVNEVQRNP
jgi:glyoxylate reductase